jgi:hypothetical protein
VVCCRQARHPQAVSFLGHMRSRTWYFKVRAAMPPDEPMARLMARVLVVWQDLLFEEAGLLVDEGFETIDKKGGSDGARRLYFLRGNSRTLVNARDLFDALMALPQFQQWLHESPKKEAELRAAFKIFNQHRAHIEMIRNRVGGHVGKEIGEALQYFDSDDEAKFEQHESDLMRPHLASDILVATICQEPERSKRMDAYRDAVQPLAAATGAMIRALSLVADMYQRKRKPLPMDPGEE